MSSTYLSTISTLAPTSGIAKGTSPAAIHAFSVGEVMEAVIADRTGPLRYLLALKNTNVHADSDLSFKIGEKLMVKVEQLKPQIVLRILSPETPSSALANDYVRIFRSNPGALMEIFTAGRDLFNQKNLTDLLPETTKDNIRNLLKIMDSLIFSQGSLKNPLFLKEYVSKLGLLQEYGLIKILQGKKDAKSERPPTGLKGALTKLSEELHVLLKDCKLTGRDDVQGLSKLAEFTESSAKAIETQQVINVLFQEHDGKYMLQIPFLFPDGIRAGEIFIGAEKGRERDAGGSRYRVVMFLSMDALGEMMVDAYLAGGKLGCVFKFEDPEARQLISSFIGELADAVRLLGYQWDYLDCVMEKNLTAVKNEHQRSLLYDRDAINLFI